MCVNCRPILSHHCALWGPTALTHDTSVTKKGQGLIEEAARFISSFEMGFLFSSKVFNTHSHQLIFKRATQTI